ncbi:pilus assembly protein TadG-related protein [Sphingomicrobium aestuariivivum]|uniref:pilus assembly protein TadG-related protein n=1 Tax=Sphingomicrobium aestuariivivum TaxID=1582356 RepID=UPI001FD69591|nr:pilus assembly protein TadG-related protein [Sphingomicrobium aestuariivivum]MCJ8191044.1 pilus assembly protein TadG-related protein [Sphingomicrobium aestuariivivum]
MIHGSEGAAAPTVALSLFALIGAGGIAFDYSRMASLDTELQNAADQATLAAASQLDGEVGACSRAARAADAFLTNETRMANDGGPTDFIVDIALEETCDATGKIRFYQDKAKTTAATDDSNANYVEVEVEARKAVFALTPIVAAFESGDISAMAFAGVSNAICKVPPLMVCNPNEELATPSTGFDVNDYIGFGLRLKANDGGGMAPGNYGFLENFASGSTALKASLGWNTPVGNCQPDDGVTTEPGNKESVTAAVNTRFDLFEGGEMNVIDCNPTKGTSLCSASYNSIKDLLRDGTSTNACGRASGVGAKGWKWDAAAAYNPTTNAPLDASVTPQVMGHPRDMCHAVSNLGVCNHGMKANSTFGDGYWDIDAYWRANHGAGAGGGYNTALNEQIWQAAGMTGMPIDPKTGAERTYPTRYMVYRWEMGGLTPSNMPVSPIEGKTVNGMKWHGRAVCDPGGGQVAGYDGATMDDTVLDRRLVTVAVLNCTAEGVAGSSTDVPVVDWIDVFMVEPSFARGSGPSAKTEYGDFYVEIVGGAAVGQDEQIQLVEKSVPYLIE